MKFLLMNTVFKLGSIVKYLYDKWDTRMTICSTYKYCLTFFTISKFKYNTGICWMLDAGCKIECFLLGYNIFCVTPHSPNSIPVCQSEPQLQIVTVWGTPTCPHHITPIIAAGNWIKILEQLGREKWDA